MVRLEEEVRLLDIASIPLAHWRFVATVVGGLLVLMIMAFLLLPDRYIARTVLLPTEDQGEINAQIAALTAQLPLGRASFAGSGSNLQVILAILESRSVADSIIQTLELKDRWKLKSLEDTRRALEDRTRIRNQNNSSISIEVRDGDPELAARIANSYPYHLNRVSIRVSTHAARQKEEFLERQLAEARGRLEEAEARLVDFQRGHGAPAVEEQARQTIEAAALLQEQVFRKELELAQIRRFATAENPQYRAAAAELAGLRAQLSRLTRGTGRDQEVFVALREAPELGINFVRVFREVEERERIYELITAGFAQARIDASRDLPIVSVLDPAVVPEKPTSRFGMARLILVALFGFVIAVAIAYGIEWFRNARLKERNRGFFESWDHFRDDLPRFRARKE